jgi:N-methylhydantoinase A
LGLTKQRPVYLRVATNKVPAASDLHSVDRTLSEVVNEASAALAAAGAKGPIRLLRTLAIRYRGQSNTLDISIRNGRFDGQAFSDTIAEFEREYEANFGEGSTDAKAGFEVVNARVVGFGVLQPPSTQTLGAMAAAGSRRVVYDLVQGPIESAIWRTSFPPPDASVAGPAIIEFPGQSVVVPPGSRAVADRLGNLHVTRQ